MKKLSLYALWIFVATSLSAHAQTQLLSTVPLFLVITARQIGPALMSGRVNDLEIHRRITKLYTSEQVEVASGNQMMVRNLYSNL